MRHSVVRAIRWWNTLGPPLKCRPILITNNHVQVTNVSHLAPAVTLGCRIGHSNYRVSCILLIVIICGVGIIKEFEIVC